MARAYNHKTIEKKWQAAWQKKKLYHLKTKGKKWYSLFEFPYPSGEGLHVGHLRPYIAMDVVSRKRRMEGYDVLFPIGWDAFGLPTENFAIKTGITPQLATKKNTDNFRRQIMSIGASLNWEREVNTTDPSYYKWTQWIFLLLFKHGLAYKAKMPINWCPKDKIGLANEEVVDGCCERCGTAVEKREKEQWMLEITRYADRLHRDLDSVDYREDVKAQQRHWIGRSEGSELTFILSSGETVNVFTTRADTLFGATYLVVAPEHELVERLRPMIRNWEAVDSYRQLVIKKTELERTAEGKQKTGVSLEGVYAINPATKERIPVWVADYVLPHYGTGAVMAVPAHDERDFEFAKVYHLPMKQVVLGVDQKNKEMPFSGEGVLMNSGAFNGVSSAHARPAITKAVGGKPAVRYKLRDWVFSRQRYWGEPIPLVFCAHCAQNPRSSKGKTLSLGERRNPGWVPVLEKKLPVKLPKVARYQPTDTGESPLSGIDAWVKTTCPRCGGAARRETDTMPNWAGSSWYFLRYLDPHNKKVFAEKKKLKTWLPVDWYNGGMEHTTLHLLYSRFWYKFLADLKLVPGSEPYQKRTSHGLILAAGGEKMSKSRGNVVAPDDLVSRFGADTLRLYEMFIGPFGQAVVWSDRAIIGARRFIERLWRLKGKVQAKKPTDTKAVAAVHRAIQKTGADIEVMGFNTAVAAFMICLGELERSATLHEKEFKMFLKILAPFIPHITEELWAQLGERASIHRSPWPVYDAKFLAQETFTLVVQVDGKTKARHSASSKQTSSVLEKEVLALPRIRSILGARHPKRVIYVPGKLINIVTR